MHSKDWKWAFDKINQSPPYYSTPKKPLINKFFSLENKTFWNINNHYFEFIHTPGHTPGSGCFYFIDEKILLSGDTLFKNSCGRTDMYGGNGKDMAQSLRRLKTLPKETIVYPGHGDQTTISNELINNFFMK